MAERPAPDYREFPQPQLDGSDPQAVLAAWQRHLINNADRCRTRLDLTDLGKAAAALAAVQLKLDAGKGDDDDNQQFILKLAETMAQARAQEEGSRFKVQGSGQVGAER
jgi:hypothetical protein